jgi:lysophospholipase L1-like esterase
MIVTTAALCAVLSACAATDGTRAPAADGNWVASWGTAQMVPSRQDELPAAQWQDASLRQIVRVSLGGRQLRVRISNAFGTEPLMLSAASVALAEGPGQSGVRPDSMRALRFDGQASVLIPAGAEYASDPVALEHGAGADLAVSMHFNVAPARQTSHPGSRANSYFTSGNKVMEAHWPQAGSVTHWYQLAGIEVLAAPGAHIVVAVGDSITDGYGVTTDSNTRWTDMLATRLRAEGRKGIGVINAGIGGGRMLRDGLGPNLVSRFDRDVLARTGVSHAIVMIGVNDLGGQHRANQDTPEARRQLLADLKLAHRQLVERAHAKGVCVIGATITPYYGSDYYKPNDENEKDRVAYNQWIRESGVFDGIADFDAALRDRERPSHLAKAYDNDGLHPSIAGYKAMADAVPLAALERCRYAAR